MSIRRHVPVAVMLLALACASPASGQKVTTVPDLTAQQVLVALANPVTARPAGEAIALTTAIEVATTPLGTSSGGFVFKLDPSTGLLTRTTTTFGPSFTERALTSGEGKVSVGAMFYSTTYDKLSGYSLTALPVGTVAATTPAASGTSTANLDISSRTLALSGIVGVTENLDIGVVVPMVSVKLAGTSSLLNGNGTVSRLAETNTTFSGLGDIAGVAKYRFVKFNGPDLQDPGGVAAVLTVRLPTGDRDNLRGLGVTRALVSGVASGHWGRPDWSLSLCLTTASPLHQTIAYAIDRLDVAGRTSVEIDLAPQILDVRVHAAVDAGCGSVQVFEQLLACKGLTWATREDEK